MTALEDKLARYKNPSSDHEKDKQDRAERMVKQAVSGWPGFEDISLRILPKGSYTNNTNVRQDSDVDVAVIHKGLHYYNDDAMQPKDKIVNAGVNIPHLNGSQLRAELEKCLYDRFRSECDTTGKTAITISESSSRVSADVVPSFEHWTYYYNSSGQVSHHIGTTTRRTDGTWVVNYPEQQYTNGVAKNNRTGGRYKYLVRILKRVENDLVAAGEIDELASYFMECLVYCVPDSKFGHSSSMPLTDDLKAVLFHIWDNTDEGGAAANWYEPNEVKKLFGTGQKWTMQEARSLASAAWNLLGLKDA